MWFRNLQLFRLTKPFDLNAESLHEKLQEDAFRECSSLEMSTIGWDRPLGKHGTLLTHQTNGNLMVCARREQKVLPAAVVREFLDDRIDIIETEQGRSVGRRERGDLRDQVLSELLPRAFTRSSRLWAYIAPREGWIVVDAPSPNRAEEVLSLLRTSLGSLPVTPVSVASAPAQVMTGWIRGAGAPGNFVLADECELRDMHEDGGVIRCRRQELASEEIMAHLNAGKQVVRLGLEWNERVSCVVGDDLSIRRLRFLDVVREQAVELETDDYAARFDSDFAIMALELSHFLADLIETFGGFEASAEAA
jgi:recombination associated protein RdgC